MEPIKVRWGFAEQEREGTLLDFVIDSADRTYGMVLSDGKFYRVHYGDLRFNGWLNT